MRLLIKLSGTGKIKAFSIVETLSLSEVDNY